LSLKTAQELSTALFVESTRSFPLHFLSVEFTQGTEARRCHKSKTAEGRRIPLAFECFYLNYRHPRKFIRILHKIEKMYIQGIDLASDVILKVKETINK
jgi:hypothetical protein